METSLPDPQRRQRLIRALALSILISFLCGGADFMGWAFTNRPQKWTWEVLKSCLPGPIGYTAVAFWILFAILFFGHVRMSAATLEYQERLRQDEERVAASKLKIPGDDRDS
jgi:hypothetical protein